MEICFDRLSVSSMPPKCCREWKHSREKCKKLSSNIYPRLPVHTSVSTCHVDEWAPQTEGLMHSFNPALKLESRAFSQRLFMKEKSWLNAQTTAHRESGINLFKQRCVQKCHSHDEVCQPALRVWWVRASSRVCSRGIRRRVCPVWF